MNVMFHYCPQCGAKLQPKQIHERTLAACMKETCGYIHWNNPTPVVAAIIEHQEKILLVHNVGWPPKILGLVTGFLEAEEDPAKAVMREVKEETNLRPANPVLIGVYPFEKMNQIIIAYHVVASGNIKLNEELDDYRLIDIDKLKPWEFGTGLAIKDWLSQRQTQ